MLELTPVSIPEIVDTAYPPTGIEIFNYIPWASMDVAQEERLCKAYYEMLPTAEKLMLINRAALKEQFAALLLTDSAYLGLQGLQDSLLALLGLILRPKYEQYRQERRSIQQNSFALRGGGD